MQGIAWHSRVRVHTTVDVVETAEGAEEQRTQRGRHPERAVRESKDLHSIWSRNVQILRLAPLAQNDNGCSLRTSAPLRTSAVESLGTSPSD